MHSALPSYITICSFHNDRSFTLPFPPCLLACPIAYLLAGERRWLTLHQAVPSTTPGSPRHATSSSASAIGIHWASPAAGAGGRHGGGVVGGDGAPYPGCEKITAVLSNSELEYELAVTQHDSGSSANNGQNSRMPAGGGGGGGDENAGGGGTSKKCTCSFLVNRAGMRYVVCMWCTVCGRRYVILYNIIVL